MKISYPVDQFRPQNPRSLLANYISRIPWYLGNYSGLYFALYIHGCIIRIFSAYFTPHGLYRSMVGIAYSPLKPRVVSHLPIYPQYIIFTNASFPAGHGVRRPSCSTGPILRIADFRRELSTGHHQLEFWHFPMTHSPFSRCNPPLSLWPFQR